MAIEDVQSFLLALEQDDSLARQADDAYVEALQSVASGAGFAFSEDDLRATLDGGGADLTDAELDHVVAGVTAAATSTNPAAVPGGSQFLTHWSGCGPDCVDPVTSKVTSFSKSGFSR